MLNVLERPESGVYEHIVSRSSFSKLKISNWNVCAARALSIYYFRLPEWDQVYKSRLARSKILSVRETERMYRKKASIST